MDLAVVFHKQNDELDKAREVDRFVYNQQYLSIEFCLCYHDNTYLVKFTVTAPGVKKEYIFALNASNFFCVKHGFIKNESEKTIVVIKSFFPKKREINIELPNYKISQLPQYNSIYEVIEYFCYKKAAVTLDILLPKVLIYLIKSYITNLEG